MPQIEKNWGGIISIEKETPAERIKRIGQLGKAELELLYEISLVNQETGPLATLKLNALVARYREIRRESMDKATTPCKGVVRVGSFPLFEYRIPG